jgi:hypothetical protein
LFASVAGVCLVTASLVARPSQQVRPVANTTAPMSVDEVLKTMRSDLQASRADIIAKNVSLTSEQAAKFWPVFEKYQKEQNAIMDAQLQGLKKYAEGYEKLDDAGALALMKTHLEQDQKMVALRVSYLGEFQKVLPAKLAARVMQIDRRLSLAHQMEFASQIPLIE